MKLNIDPEAIREKYRLERERRLREDHAAQYVKAAGEFSRYTEDRMTERSVREPLLIDTEAVIVGGGFGGLMAAARLHDKGIVDIKILDAAGDFGGTWYYNRYPGASCDTEAYCYLPLLEETGYMPSCRYPNADEIFAHAQRIGRNYELYERALFQTSVTRMDWSEETQCWTVKTNRGDVIRARHVMVCGTTGKGKLPGIPGLKDFKGKMFHNNRWDYEYTGGSVTEDLDKLRDKRVAVIGTGASAVQFIPALGRSAKEVFVFQRTPSAVGPRGDKLTDPQWWAELTSTPGWQERRKKHQVAILEGGIADDGDFKDSGFVENRRTIVRLTMEILEEAKVAGQQLSDQEAAELANMKFMTGLRARCDEEVEDPATAESLKPYYKYGCKRPVWNDHYLKTFNRDNVTLVDTLGKGVERFTETGILFNGVEYEVDLIVLASGQQTGTTGVDAFTDIEVHGRDGLELKDWWSDEIRTVHGMHIHNFPNFYMVGPLGVGFSVNYLYTSTHQTAYMAELLAKCRTESLATVEPTFAAESQWRKAVDESQENTGVADFLADCTPGYYNAEGKVSEKRSLFGNIYARGAQAYVDLLREGSVDGRFEGLVMGRDRADVTS